MILCSQDCGCRSLKHHRPCGKASQIVAQPWLASLRLIKLARPSVAQKPARSPRLISCHPCWLIPRLSGQCCYSVLITHLVQINNNIDTVLLERFHICNLLFSSLTTHKLDKAALLLICFYRKGIEDQKSQVICSKPYSWQMVVLALKSYWSKQHTVIANMHLGWDE